MTRYTSLFAALAFAFGVAACGGDDDDDDTAQPDAAATPDGETSNIVEVADDIGSDTTWTADKVYVLEDNIFVRDATLTVEAGTLIQGQNNSSLVVTNTAEIQAVGTASDPIVFTSGQPEGTRLPGDWGGIVLLGNATINVTGGTDNIEGFPAGTEGTEFGGTDDSHDCGTLKYVRIEFAGFELSTDNELNGLTVGACGSDTVLDYIQVHKGADDGVEFFGGKANLKHVIVTQPDDDGIDWDFGWSGNGQFLIVQQSSTAGNFGFESDSNKNDNDATPRSAPTIWNLTLIGSNSDPGNAIKTQGGMLLRRGTAGLINNAIIAYFTDFAVDIADYSTAEQATAATPTLAISNSYFFDNANDTNDGWPADFDVDEGEENDCESSNTNCLDEHALFTGASLENAFGTDPQLADALNLTAPDFAPASALTGATPGSGFDASATYVGAIGGGSDWTDGWTAFPAN